MASAIERTANERAQNGWELVTFSVTNSARAILVFRVPYVVLGMMLGVAVGLCTGPAIGALRKNKKAENQKDNEKQ